MTHKPIVWPFVVVAALLIGSAPASGGPLLISATFDGENDCAGLFGKPADPCDVGYPLGEDISPWIAKISFRDDGSIEETEVNSAFATVDMTEFYAGLLPSALGTWTYTQGAGDPDARYWVAKGGNSFNLFWQVEGDTVGDLCDTPYSIACLNLASAVNSGTWFTPGGADLSHITWYDGQGAWYETEDHIPNPEPSTLLLLGSGLAAAGVRRYRRKH